MSPYIGITCDLKDDPSGGDTISFIKNRYIEAVSDAGGIPVLLPSTAVTGIVSLFSKSCHGLLITGGDFDIPSERYGETPIGEEKTIPERTKVELELLQHAAAAGKPVLGICGGHQLINVCFGGTLFQDIPSQRPGSLNHNPGDASFTHPVAIEDSTQLFNILGTNNVEVNSTHHQSLRKIAPGFSVSARADDGVVEAIERDGGEFIVGVQWHPEFMRRTTPLFDRLFMSFIQAARKPPPGATG